MTETGTTIHKNVARKEKKNKPASDSGDVQNVSY